MKACFRLLFLAVFLFSVKARAQLSKSSSFLERKNQISFSFQKGSGANIFAVALVKTECLKEDQGRLPSWLKTSKRILSGVSAQSVRFSLQKVSEKQLRLAEANACVLALADEGVVEVAGLNDPLFKDQAFYPFLHFLKYFSIFSSPVFYPLTKAVVAVVDSGISLSHPEFIGKFWNDGRGHVGYNFLDDSFDVEDGLGHGSHVSGLVAANANNGVGVVGLSQAVQLMVLKTQGSDGKGSVGDVADAIRYAADHGADVINLSLSIGGDNPYLKEAVNYALEKGSLLVAASGNNGKQITDSDFISPAGWGVELQGLISVGSVDSATGELSSFSNYSSDLVEMTAPGSHGLTTHILSTYKEGRYFAMAGTSQATPQVAGAAAQIIAYFKTYHIPYTSAVVENFILDHSKSNPKLQGLIEQNRQLDLEVLSKALLKNYHLSSDGGLND